MTGPTRNPVPRPVVYDYGSAAQFLSELLAHYKSAGPFSLRQRTSRVQGCSQALVSQILNGRRQLNRDNLPAVAAVFKLTPAETRFLDERLFARAGKAAPEPQAPARKERRPRNGLLSDWLHPYVKDLVNLKGFRDDPEVLHAMLRGLAPASRIMKSVDFLLREGFWRRTSAGRIVPDEPAVTTTNEIPNDRIRAFHKKALEIALRGLATLPTDRRKASTILISVDREHLNDLKGLIDSFQHQLLEFIERHPNGREELVQVAFTSHPSGAIGMKNTKFRLIKIALLCGIAWPIAAARASGTVVGNGGDPLFEFLEAARGAMVATLKIIANDPRERDQFCAHPRLSPEQVLYCRDFFLTVLPDVLRLNQGTDKVLFVLREDPLLVEGPDGRPMPVAARTALGPAGPVEWHRFSIQTLPPSQVLFLMAHEFQHKAGDRGKFLTDNEPIGPFATGRELIDAAASGVVAVAKRKGKIGTQFGIRDIFDCRVFTGGSGFGARLSSTRLFRAEDLMSYQTSFGRNPTDGSIFLPETADTSIRLRFVISEPANCGPADPARSTQVQILQVREIANLDPAETVLASRILSDNPMCPGSSPQFEIATDSVRFACRYFGSEGTTSSPLGRSSKGRF